MDSPDSLEYSGTQWSLSTLKNFNVISLATQKHLQKVYALLVGAVLIGALGVWVHIVFNIGGAITTLGFFATSMILFATSPSESNMEKRLVLLVAASFLEGATIGCLVKVVLHVDPRLLLVASTSTLAVFISFSGMALVARRRQYLFLGAVLSSALTTVLFLHLASMLFGATPLVNNVQLYGGLFVFVGYVVFDTQVIIERVEMGDTDAVKHALDLFVDVVAIFVRILLILVQLQHHLLASPLLFSTSMGLSYAAPHMLAGSGRGFQRHSRSHSVLDTNAFLTTGNISVRCKYTKQYI